MILTVLNVFDALSLSCAVSNNLAKEEEIWRILGECADRKDGRAKSIWSKHSVPWNEQVMPIIQIYYLWIPSDTFVFQCVLLTDAVMQHTMCSGLQRERSLAYHSKKNGMCSAQMMILCWLHMWVTTCRTLCYWQSSLLQKIQSLRRVALGDAWA